MVRSGQQKPYKKTEAKQVADVPKLEIVKEYFPKSNGQFKKFDHDNDAESEINFGTNFLENIISIIVRIDFSRI